MDTEPGSTGNPLADLALSLRDWALGQWEITLLLALFAIFRWWFGKSYEETDSRQGLITFLRHAHAANAYKLLVGWLLDRTDRWCLSPAQYARKPEHRPAWSLSVFDRVLLLALLYPLLALFLQWAVTDRNGFLGAVWLLPAGSEPAWRIGVGAACATALLAAICMARAPARRARLGWLAVAGIAAIALAICTLGAASEGAHFFSENELNWFPQDPTAPIATLDMDPSAMEARVREGVRVLGNLGAAQMTTASAVLIVLSAVSAALMSPTHPGLAAFCGTAIGILTLGLLFGAMTLPDAWEIELAGSFYVSDLLQSLVLILVVMGTTAVLASAHLAGREGGGLRPFGYGGILLFALVAITLGATLLFGLHQLLVLLMLLPFLNAAFDFGSLGLTRWALRRAVRRVGRRTFLYSALDAGAAAVLFLALGCATLVMIHFLVEVFFGTVIRLSGGDAIGAEACASPLVDVNLFHAIRTCPGDYWWLYLTFFSTLLPTIVHLMVAAWAIGPAILGGNARRWLAATLETSEQHFGRRWIALSVLSAWSAFAVAAPVVILFWIGGWVAHDHPDWGLALLGFFEWFYHQLPGA
ncbi:MAG: hypothetical protein AAF409_12390 [Pseudomonadota bacterium]